MAAVCVGAFMGQLDASIVTVALPTLQQTFDASVGAVTWVGLSYLLVLVATVTAVGRFADMWGRKLLYVYGFVIFVVASVFCGLAPGPGRPVRLPRLQAVGAAMLQANSLAIIVLVVPAAASGGHRFPGGGPSDRAGPRADHRRAAAGGRWVAVDLLRQRALRDLRCHRRPGSGSSQPEPVASGGLRLDGLAVFFPAVVALLSAISFGATLGWSSPLILALFIAAAVLLGVFFWHDA